MKNQKRSGMMVVIAALALPMAAQAATIQYTFQQEYPLTASPSGVPSFDVTWNIPQFDGFGGLSTLTGVSYDVSTQILYRGVLVGIGASTSFNLLVRSDFNFDLPTSTADVTALDPQILRTPTSGASDATFNVPGPADQIASSTANSANRIATDFVTYVGSGTVPVTATGALLQTSPGGTYHNNSASGPQTPFVFVDNAKIFPMFGMQEFSLVATMIVTYTVPEPSTYGAAGLLALLALHQWHRRRNISR